jgi:hypothetical protein
MHFLSIATKIFYPYLLMGEIILKVITKVGESKFNSTLFCYLIPFLIQNFLFP